MELGEIIKQALIKSISEALTMLWNIAEVRNLVIEKIIGFITFIITFRIVGRIMREAKVYGIWIGSFWGKVIYFLISSIISGTIGYITGKFITFLITCLLNSGISFLNKLSG
ncbi:MAG: hypothetical protein LLF98_09795 [Clostridium sp.]|uniref:hypothetical protein n=1 Tax=Clostridium sp. TaxID=1506 RepID=UPI0025C11AF7|nr:hypothetical protein [Clostridium sp.]MCE5221533.1 hypothetical protein [Clostridium sp.]